MNIQAEGIAIEVYHKDLDGRYSWDEAVKVSEALGKGWRLPKKYELDWMCQRKEDIGGFGAYYYWSSSEYCDNYAWYQNFFNGYQNSSYKYTNYRVRPVRDLKPDKERIDKVVSETTSTWMEEAEEYEANKKLYDRIAELEIDNLALTEGLEHIMDYWNKDRNDSAMHDALWEIINTADDLLSKHGGKS